MTEKNGTEGATHHSWRGVILMRAHFYAGAFRRAGTMQFVAGPDHAPTCYLWIGRIVCTSRRLESGSTCDKYSISRMYSPLSLCRLPPPASSDVGEDLVGCQQISDWIVHVDLNARQKAGRVGECFVSCRHHAGLLFAALITWEMDLLVESVWNTAEGVA